MTPKKERGQFAGYREAVKNASKPKKNTKSSIGDDSLFSEIKLDIDAFNSKPGLNQKSNLPPTVIPGDMAPSVTSIPPGVTPGTIEGAMSIPPGVTPGVTPGTIEGVMSIPPGVTPGARVGAKDGTILKVKTNPEESKNKAVGPPIDESQKPSDLTLIQYRLLHQIYFQRPFKASGDYNIGNPWKMNRGTISKALIKLTKSEYIHKPYAVHNGLHKLTTCAVNEEKCKAIFGPTKIKNPSVIPQSKSSIPPGVTPGVIQGTIAPLNSKSVSLFKTDLLKRARAELLTPHMAYWRKRDLTPERIVKMVSDLSLENDSAIGHLFRNLAYAAYAWTDDSKIKSPLDKIFVILRDHGGMPRPEGFLTPSERMLKQIQEETEAERQNSEKLKQAREKLQRIKIERQWEEFLADPSTPEYQKLYASLNKTDRKRMDGGKPFALRMAWMKQMGYEDEA